MTDQELFEKLKRDGECWHALELHNMEYRRCKLCSRGFSTENGIVDSLTGEHINPDFSTWEGFGWLWERVGEKEWFHNHFLPAYNHCGRYGDIAWWFINPTRFTEALKEYLE